MRARGGNESHAIRIVPGQLSVFIHDGIDSADQAGSLRYTVEVFHHLLFERHREVEPEGVQIAENPDRLPKFLLPDVKREVDRIDPQRHEGKIMHGRGQAVRHRASHQSSESCVSSNLVHGIVSCLLPRLLKKKPPADLTGGFQIS